MIKSLVSPREVVFRFPFQLEGDWAFQRRSAVKSGLYMRGLEDTYTAVLSWITNGLLYWTLNKIQKCNCYIKNPLGVVYRSPFDLYLNTETCPGRIHHHQQTTVTSLCPGNFTSLYGFPSLWASPLRPTVFYHISFTSSSVLRPLLQTWNGRERETERNRLQMDFDGYLSIKSSGIELFWVDYSVFSVLKIAVVPRLLGHTANVRKSVKDGRK